jgi:hypothetical protein
MLLFATLFYSNTTQPTDINVFWENRIEIDKVQNIMNSWLNRDWCYPVTSYRNEQYVALVDLCQDWHYKIISMDYKNLKYRRLWDYQLLQLKYEWL